MSSERATSGNSTVAVLLAALIVSGSMLGSAYLLSRSMGDMSASVGDMKVALEKAMAPRAPAQPAAARGPDPDKRYTLKTEGAPARGAKSPKVTIVEISDFQCPFCKRVEPTLAQLMKDYPDSVQIVYKHLPLDFHPKAPAAHAAAEAAHRQGKFWEMYAKIFDNQAELSPEKYEVWARELGLDVDQFKKDTASAEVKARIDADKSEAGTLGVSGTPAFFINGRYLSGAQPVEQFKAIIDEELKRTGG